MTDDFIARLRIRFEEMGATANNERAAAADEIEFLRNSRREVMRQLVAAQETLRIVNDSLEERTAERDIARLRAASFIGMIEIMGDMLLKRPSKRSAHEVAKEYAKECGWDCFKEKTND